MIKPIEKGIMRKITGNNPVGTHIQHECLNGHKTLRHRNNKNYKCQKCLAIKFNEQLAKPKNQEFLPLKELSKLI